jgi:triacylglycerol esterase/lipase EstA (alpha/beta hydrolase family)
MRWLPELARHKVPFIAVNLEPVFGSIDGYIGILDKAIKDMHAATGQPPLLVCHSMGGLAARAWCQTSGAQDSAIHRIVTIASPHHGTRISSGFPTLSWMTNAGQMRDGSIWLEALALKETAAQRNRFTCFYSNCDNIVMPAATARLEGADNRLIPGVPHVAMALDVGIMRETMAMLDDVSTH